MADDLTPRVRKQIDRIADSLVDQQRRLRDLERSPQIPFSSLHGSLPVIGDDDTVKAIVGKQPDGTYTTKSVDGPVPAAPSQLVVEAGESAAAVSWDGRVVTGSVPADFKTLRIEAALDGSDVWLAKGVIPAPEGGSANIGLHAGDWLVRGRVVSESGKVSAPGVAVSVTIEPPVDVDALEDGIADAKQRLDEYRDEVAAPRFQALEEGMETHADNLADARDRLETAEQTLSPLPGRIESAEQDVETAKEAAVEAGAAAVEANNRAMTRLANGNFESGLDYWTGVNVSVSDTAHSGVRAASLDHGGGHLSPESSFPVVPDQIWELSLYYRGDVAVAFQSVEADTRTTLESFDLDGDAAWADSGALRVTVPAGVDMLSFTIAGEDALVDDVTLRDVTDVVRLEQAANANRQKAEQAISELAVLQLAVDGEGGLKDRLASAETVLDDKADTSALDQLDQKLSTNLAAIESHYSKVWRQPTPPPPGTQYAWLGEPHRSVSVRLDGDGNETARNHAYNSRFAGGTTSWRLWSGTSIETNEAGNLVVNYPGTQGTSAGVAQFLNEELPAGTYTITAKIRRSTEDLTTRFQLGSANQFDPELPPVGEWGIIQSVLTPSSFDRFYIYRNNAGAVGTLEIEWVILESGETDGSYFDGSTPSDRANDLWYNQDGVPHEWINGQGWTAISDARITELANTVSAHATRLTDAETELGKKATTSALNALAGTVAGNTTAIGEAQQALQDAQDDLDTALTGPVDHDRLRAGTGAFNQAFIARLVADSVQAMSAEFEQLTVTELANFARIIGDEIWAELAVFDRLDAREAYVGGTHLKDGAVTAEKMTITGDLAAAIVSADKARIAELISDEIWADLGVFDRLQAREGWIGGTLLADGAVTAEKIHATRELITRIMGAEWAYISERLVVDGDLIANNADIISAAIKNLSVTERADLFEAFITTLGAQEAVIDLLIGTEAWIGGTMLKDDTVTTQHIEFTETLVGNIAELLHLVVDRIDVNSLWADQTWQAAGHFGSEDADQQTRVDGQGVTLYRKIEGEFIPAAQFGGGDLQLTFFDDAGEATGAITRDGHVSGALANFQQFQWQGRPVFGTAIPEGNTPVFDSVTQGFIARNERVLNGTADGAGRSEYGFLPLSFQAQAGMTYEITVPGIQMWNIDQAVIHAEIHYTTDGRPAVLSDPILGRSQWAVTTHSGTQKVVPQFTRFFHCEDGCEVNLLLCVRASDPVPRWWHAVETEASTAELWVRPVGVTPPIVGGVRDVYTGHPDLGGGETSYYTGWTPTWHQAYLGAAKYTGSSTWLLSGMAGARYSTHFGGYRNSPGYSGQEDAGATMGQALAGAFVTDGTLTLTGVANATASSGQVWVQWHTHTTAPATFVSQYDTRLISSVHVSAGQQSVIDLPRVVLDAIQSGTFQGFTLHHPTSTTPYVSMYSQASITTRTRQPMMRLRYVR